MKILRILCLSLLILFAGCSYKEPKTCTLSQEKKDEMHMLLSYQPEELMSVMLEEMDSGVLIDEKQLEQKSMQETFSKMLLQTDRKELLADNEFEKIKDVLSQSNIDTSTLFASGLSKYMSDPDYVCKEPQYYKYFAERYGVENNRLACTKRVPFSVLSKNGLKDLLWLDPKRVSSVHVLFAGNGNGIISKFGHISMRLVVCPEDDYSEKACNENLYEHIVVGYRAHIDELKIDTFKGLMGDYRAYLFVNSFMDIYQEYAIGEFRDLYSLPLKLSKEQREDVVRAMSEIHWSYSGDYKFLTKNCSTLMQHALSGIWKEFSQDKNLEEIYWRPDNFFSELRKSDLSEFDRLEDLNRAEEDGYYFPSTGPVYKKALQVVKKAMSKPKFNTIDEYININPEIRYKSSVDDEPFYERLKSKKFIRDAQLLLEELSTIRFEARMMAEMSYFFEKNDMKSISKHMKKELSENEFTVFSQCMLEPILALTKPIRRMQGIPTDINYDKSSENSSSCYSEESKKSMKKIKTELERIDFENWNVVKLAAYYLTESRKNVEKYTSLEKI